MNHVSVSRSALTLSVMAAVMVATACEDKRVKELHSGMPRDSVVNAISRDMKPGAPPDSFGNVYTRNRYRIAGKDYEVLFFTANNEKVGKDTVPWKKLTPLVFIDGKLVGRGWEFWDSVSTANNIPLQKR